MSERDDVVIGAPCWVDLWTSDVEAARRFYAELFGWVAEEENPRFGGYFMFTQQGRPVAGAMGPMPDRPASNTWKAFFATDDVVASFDAAIAGGAEGAAPVMPVDELGTQAVLADPTGAAFGLWQAGTFSGFPAMGGPGLPSWFELRTPDCAAAVAFYSSLLGWQATDAVDGDTRYTTVRPNARGEEFGGITSVPGGAGAARWVVYWRVDDIDAALAAVKSAGGSVHGGPTAGPYGVLATVADPAGAELALHVPAAT